MKACIVTGAASGIGRAVAQMLAQRGWAVAAVDCDEIGLGTLGDELRGNGARTHIFAADVRDGARIAQVVDATERQLGPVEGLVHAAAILRTGPLLDQSDADWDAVLEVNMGGTRTVCNAVARNMVARKRGAIVVVASNAARVPRVDMGAYCASTAAVVMFVKCLGLELAGYNVRCNAVSPGSTDTAMQRALWCDERSVDGVIEGSLRRFRTGIPLNRIATPDDIAEVACFLLEDRARHLTIADLCIDGGATLGV